MLCIFVFLILIIFEIIVRLQKIKIFDQFEMNLRFLTGRFTFPKYMVVMINFSQKKFIIWNKSCYFAHQNPVLTMWQLPGADIERKFNMNSMIEKKKTKLLGID